MKKQRSETHKPTLPVDALSGTLLTGGLCFLSSQEETSFGNWFRRVATCRNNDVLWWGRVNGDPTNVSFGLRRSNSRNGSQTIQRQPVRKEPSGGCESWIKTHNHTAGSFDGSQAPYRGLEKPFQRIEKLILTASGEHPIRASHSPVACPALTQGGSAKDQTIPGKVHRHFLVIKRSLATQLHSGLNLA